MITSRIMDRRRLEIIALVLILLLTFICWETTARLFWKNSPQLVLPFNDDIFMKVDDPEVYYALKPGERFYYQGAAGFINRKGMRGREVMIPKPKNTFRVVMTGDETVFGPGLKEDSTLPARLQEVLQNISGGRGMNVEVINAGVPGYSFFSSAAITGHIAVLQPDLVLIVISEDDFEIQGVGEGAGRTPAAISARQPPTGGWLKGVGRFMLPDKEARFRYFIANVSRGYLMAAMAMKGTHGAELTGVPVEIGSAKYKSLGSNYPANTSSCQADRVVWGRVEKALKKVSSAATDGGFNVAGVIYSDFSLRGREAIRIYDAFEKMEISLINLSVYRKNEDAEKKEHNLKWINLPNAAAHEENGKFLADALWEKKLLEGYGLKNREATGKYEKLAKVRRNMYWELVNGQEVRDRIERNDFRDRVDFSSRGAHKDGQILYGWWPAEEMAWMGRPELAWVSDSAAVILKKPQGADTLHVEGGIYPSALEAGGLRVTFSFECMKPETVYVVRGSFFEADVPIPSGLDRREFLEISVDAKNPFIPMEVGGKEGDDRIISLGVATMKLFKQDKTEKAVGR